VVIQIAKDEAHRENAPGSVRRDQCLECLLEVQLAHQVDLEACGVVFENLMVEVIDVSEELVDIHVLLLGSVAFICVPDTVYEQRSTEIHECAHVGWLQV